VHVDDDADVLRLHAVVRDLVALSAIPAVWIGSEPPAVAAGLADALVGLLQLDFAFVRLSDPGGGGAIEARRGTAWTGFPEWLEDRLATSAPFPPKEVVPDVGDDSVPRRGFAVPVGVNGEAGVVAAAAERSDFPTQKDQLLLSIAANHAAAAFQTARLIHERKRAEGELRTARNELEVKVAERTAELCLANDELSALRHVATLVAEGARPQDLFAVVAEEVARVVDVPLVSVVRYGPDGKEVECANYSRRAPGSEPARIGDDSQLHDDNAAAVRGNGTPPTVRVPIVVAGRVWGAVVVSATKPESLPEGTEARLADFTELLATALENAESREALGRLAEEQAALRRVATLVARDVRPVEIFSAVVEEVGRLFGTDTAAVVRFEHDPPAIVVAGVAKGISGIPIGTRSELDDALASTEVYRTGCSARIDARDWPSPKGPIHGAGRRLGLVSTVASPIIVEGRLWGAMTISAKERLPRDAEERLENFTELVATAVANVDSRAELAASRRRIVGASDEARRRIERDLHDGTQQQLIALQLAVRATDAHVPADNRDLRAELSRIAAGLADAVADLQETSRGIHPAILSRGGLGPALRTLARRSPIPVRLDAPMDARLPEPIEVAAYYVASEALANATKHAHASRIEISLATRDDRLLLSVRDDGIGGADALRGSGLVGLTDRVHALAGSIRVSSPPGHGTHITAELPVETTPEQRPPPTD
jgi:signal transduction histidine kinase